MSTTIPVAVTNDVSSIMVKTLFDAGAMAVATHGLNLIDPTGGAILGGTLFLSKYFVALIAKETLGGNSLETRALATALVVLGAMGAAWGALALAGYTLGLSHLVSISSVGLVLSAATTPALKLILGKIPDPCDWLRIP